MIKTKDQLKEWLIYEKKLYTPKKRIDRIVGMLCGDYSCYIWKFVRCLRISEYHLNNSSFKTSRHSINALYHDLAFLIRRFQRIRLGIKCNIEIFENSFDKGLCIFHCVGGVLVNGYARVGKDCMIHGNNCIGNKAINDSVPTIGNHVEIGYGATIVGNVVIGDNTVIAANAVVVTSFPKGNVVIGGCPAKVIRDITVIGTSEGEKVSRNS